MQRLYTTFAAAALFSVSLLSCKKSDDGGSNPGTTSAAGYKNDGSYARLAQNASMLAQQPDKKVLVAAGDKSITRFNTDGTIDKSFIVDAGVVSSSFVYSAMTVQPDGKILLAANKATSQSGVGIVRLNADGSKDNSFSTPALKTATNNTFATVNTILLLSDGHILVGGEFSYQSGSGYYYHVARLNANGTIDQGFKSPLPITSSNNVMGMTQTKDGNVIISGAFGLYVGNDITYDLVKINSENGSAVSGFKSANHTYSYYAGFGGDAGARQIIELSDGRLLLSGGFTGVGLAASSAKQYPGLARINSDGSADESFQPDYGGPVAVQSDGTIVFGTASSLVGETLPAFFGTMNANGKLNGSLSNLGFDKGNATCILRTGDNEYILGGGFYKSSDLYGCFRIKK